MWYRTGADPQVHEFRPKATIAEKLIMTPDMHNNGRMGFTSQQ